MADVEYNTTVDPDAIRQLRQFRADNSYNAYEMPENPDEPATDQEVRSLLIFAANCAPLSTFHVTPRELEAIRVIRLVPKDVGAALFERTDRG